MSTNQTLPIRQGVHLSLVLQTLSLSLGLAIAQGIARFSYALLLPPIKTALHWNFAQAGALNTSNGLGYLLGALIYPVVARYAAVQRLFLGGCVLLSGCMALPGFFDGYDALLAQRAACGVLSALVFVSGGILASRLATSHAGHSGLVLGLFYGGPGLGITLSALVVPAALLGHDWPAAWTALGLTCALCTALAWPAAIRTPADGPPPSTAVKAGVALLWRRCALLLAAYGLFGVGYIGYMTFVIALLRSTGLGSATLLAFFVVLGLAAAVSGKVWAGALHRARGGGACALCCGLLSVATLVPAVMTSPVAAFASGLVFGGTFLAVTASTTAFVRHHLPPAQWSAGISVFTVVFAIGQIVGPVVLGAISDGSGLARGFVYSAGVLLAASLLAAGQKPLAPTI